MKVAIIGSGISGLGTAYLLKNKYDITLFEKNDYLGGHSRTVEVPTSDGTIPVDTGFIVFNKRNYPLLTGLFKHLNIPISKSDMSFGVSISDGWLEYGTQNLKDMFAQKSNVLRPQFIKMLLDILKFNSKAKKLLEFDQDISLDEAIAKMGLGTWFRNYYLLAMGGAIWSTPLSGMDKFPAKTFIQFFDNHGLLTVNDQPQWYTVRGGSKEYVKRITLSFKDKIKKNCAIKKVERKAKFVEITDVGNKKHKFDQVVFACHSDQVMNILSNPSEKEKKIIGSIKYQPNKMVLHTDTSFMPKRKSAWSSWVYLSEGKADNHDRVSLSYWMNNLQPINTKLPIIVTLNPYRMPKEKDIIDQYNFDHPVFDLAAIKAQESIDEIQGIDRIWYAGAYLRYGFHEDGLLSAVNVAKKMGVEALWN